jgi:hypothetical protein
MSFILRWLGKEILKCKHCNKPFLDRTKLMNHQRKCKKERKKAKRLAKKRRRSR